MILPIFLFDLKTLDVLLSLQCCLRIFLRSVLLVRNRITRWDWSWRVAYVDVEIDVNIHVRYENVVHTVFGWDDWRWVRVRRHSQLLVVCGVRYKIAVLLTLIDGLLLELRHVGSVCTVFSWSWRLGHFSSFWWEFEDSLLVTLLIGLRSHWIVEVRRHHETWCVRHVVVGHQVIHVLILLQVVLHSSAIRIVNGLKTTIILFVVWSWEDVHLCRILLGRGFHVVLLFYSFTVLTRATFKGLLGWSFLKHFIALII